jgi:hypothetical protein
MAIGHWKTLTEAQKLTQSQLIPGVVEEDIFRNNLLDNIPVAQASGKSIKWNREKVVLDDDVAGADIGDELNWTSDMEYEQQEVELKRKYLQRVLDHFIPDVYGTINNYEAQVLLEMKKGMVRRLGNDLIYDDLTYGGTLQFDGLHALAAVQTGTDLDIDEGEAGLSLANLRKMLDAQKAGTDFIYMPFEIARLMDAAYQEAGFAALATASAGNLGLINYGVNEMGKRVMYFDGVPILRTDFLVAENANTGVGSDARAKYTSGDKQYSVFGIKFGDIFNGEPGLTLGFGNTEMLGQFYKLVPFENLEDYDAAGIRMISYVAPLLGSKLSLARIYDIEAVAVVA